MTTIFACPKPFEGHVGLIQRNAVASWRALRSRPEVVLFGDESGTSALCEALGLRHYPRVQKNEYGTPLLNDLFAAAQLATRTPYLAYVNADILLFDDFGEGVEQVVRWSRGRPFVLAGMRTQLWVDRLLDFSDSACRQRLRAKAEACRGKVPGGIDYLVFPRGLYQEIPPFALGRGWWDQWLVWEAHRRGALVVDASPAVLAVHQDHDYNHTGQGEDWIWKGPEIARNRELIGSPNHLWHTGHADYELTARGVRRLLTRRFLTLLKDRTRPWRHKIGLRRGWLRRVAAARRYVRFICSLTL